MKPCHHRLETYLDEYIAVAGVAGDKDAPLFMMTGQRTDVAQRMGNRHHRLPEERRHPRTRAGDGNHSSPRTAKLYDRRNDEPSLDEYERVGI